MTSPSEVEVAPGLSGDLGVRDLGAVSNSTPFDLAVGLALRDASGFASYLTALDLPGTPAYHDFLSASDLAARFGATPASIAAASAYFESYGLGVTVSPDRLLLDVQGPASGVGPAFGTTFDRYLGPTGREFISHPTPAMLPGSVGWTGVLGLGNSTPLTPAATSGSASVPLVGPAAACSGTVPFVPCQVWQAYDMSGLIGAGTTG
ncbi:MAG: protease pro-enzyme activation domain-containing protein, partial [Thermoplasmata archaeon]